MNNSKSILEELVNYAPKKDIDLFISSRAQQVIASASHLIKLLYETYDQETAEDLTKNLLKSISSGNETKFTKKIISLRENKNEK